MKYIFGVLLMTGQFYSTYQSLSLMELPSEVYGHIVQYVIKKYPSKQKDLRCLSQAMNQRVVP
jgi:hypothetical protein